ncbi:MAG TPA: hypothetical protein VI455_13155, partial [Terriglobia bacterium]
MMKTHRVTSSKRTEPIDRCHRRLVTVAVTIALICACGGKATHSDNGQGVSLAAQTEPQRLSPQGQSALEALVASGQLADLRWPDFTDYRAHVNDFYEPVQYALAWMRGGTVTPQALAVIALLENADSKGLHAEDYDGPRWAGRLEKLRQSSPPTTEDELGRFDLALTVSLMRYISDLHIGKVNPRHFNFGLDIENKKYKLQDLLRERIVNGTDVNTVLAQVEPQFDGYRRTIQALQTYL